MKLHIYRRDTLERTLDLTGGDLRIGRGVENDLVLDDADKTVSRFHAELRQEQDEYVLIDLNSQHGTWVDGQRVQHTTLAPGMTVAMGHFRLVLEAPVADGERSVHVMPPDASSARPAMYGGAQSTGHGGHGASGSQASAGGASEQARVGVQMAAPAMTGAVGSNAAGPQAAAARAAVPSAASVPARRAGAARVPKPMLYAACAAGVMLLIGIPYLLWPSADRAASAHVGNGTAEAAGPAGGPQGVQRDAARERTRWASAASNAAPATQAGATQAGTVGEDVSEKTPPPAAAPSSTSSLPAAAASSAAPKSAAAAPGAPGPGGRPLTRAERAANARREQAAANLYAQGKAALAAGKWTEAIAAFEQVLRDRPNHLDTPALLEQAKTGVRNDAAEAASRAGALAAGGDFAGALREYERARQIDPSLEAAGSGIADVRAKMKSAGDQAYKRARQLEAVGRLQDAATQYTRATELLPPDDPNGKTARERLDLLSRQP